MEVAQQKPVANAVYLLGNAYSLVYYDYQNTRQRKHSTHLIAREETGVHLILHQSHEYVVIRLTGNTVSVVATSKTRGENDISLCLSATL